MVAEKQAPASSLPLGSIATLLLFVAGIIIPNVPLESQRPRELEPAKDRIVGIQDADARLWQDPFSAAVRHLSKIEKLQDLKSPKFAQDGRGDSNHSCARLRGSGRHHPAVRLSGRRRTFKGILPPALA